MTLFSLMEKTESKRTDGLLADGQVKQLISFVEKTPDLWIISRVEYHSGVAKRNQLWADIARELRCTEVEAKYNWYNVRNNFRAKLLERRDASAQQREKIERWQWWRDMQFLADGILSKYSTKPSSNNKKKKRRRRDKDETDEENSEEDVDGDSAEEDNANESNVDQVPINPHSISESMVLEPLLVHGVEMDLYSGNTHPSSTNSSVDAFSVASIKRLSKKKTLKKTAEFGTNLELTAVRDMHERTLALLTESTRKEAAVNEEADDNKFADYVRTILSNQNGPDKVLFKSMVRATIAKFFSEQYASQFADGTGGGNGLPTGFI